MVRVLHDRQTDFKVAVARKIGYSLLTSVVLFNVEPKWSARGGCNAFLT